MRRIARLCQSVALAGALAACSTPYAPPQFAARPPGRTEFPGIGTLAAAAPGRALDVLLVHGMCTHDRRWAEEAVTGLAGTLRAEPLGPLEEAAVAGTQVTLYQQTLALGGVRLRANAILWSPVLAPLKRQLCYDQSAPSALCRGAPEPAPAYPYGRASVNALLKDGLLDDCLADALIYQGRSRDAVSAQIQAAMLQALASSGGRAAGARRGGEPAAPLVVVAESLGSKVAFDALYKLVASADPARRAAGEDGVDRLAQVFMAANQMPVLALADQALDGTAGLRAHAEAYPADPLDALFSMKKQRRADAAARPPRVVAFTDPNDLLSWILVPARAVAPYEVVDVIVSNAPTLFGFIERPDTAHQGYLANPAVQTLIACGHPARDCP